MTVTDAVIELWQLAGEPSDFDPFDTGGVTLDPASNGTLHYLRQLSLAQQTLANWRTSGRRPIRFDKFMTRKNVKVGYTTQDYACTVIDKYTLRLITPASHVEPELLESSKIIFTYTPAGGVETAEEIEATIADQNGVNIDLGFRDEMDADIAQSGTCSIHFNQFDVRVSSTRATEGETLVLPINFRNIVKLISMADSGEIFQAESKEALDDYNQTLGTPTKYYGLGDKIYLDTYLEEPFWLTVEYQRVPNDLALPTDSFDIPTQWHGVLILLVEWNTAKMMHENEKSQMLLGEVNRIIGTMRTDQEEAWLRTNTSGVQIRREART